MKEELPVQIVELVHVALEEALKVSQLVSQLASELVVSEWVSS